MSVTTPALPLNEIDRQLQLFPCDKSEDLNNFAGNRTYAHPFSVTCKTTVRGKG